MAALGLSCVRQDLELHHTGSLLSLAGSFCLMQDLHCLRRVFIATSWFLTSCCVQAPEHLGWVVVAMGLVALWHVGYEFLDQGSHLCPLHWKADS